MKTLKIYLHDLDWQYPFDSLLEDLNKTNVSIGGDLLNGHSNQFELDRMSDMFLFTMDQYTDSEYLQMNMIITSMVEGMFSGPWFARKQCLWLKHYYLR